ncbi:hypothetical protein Taro_015885, partial [Colocasia esculenta]|nr:hypothetical protein [Colocasia esculenta]
LADIYHLTPSPTPSDSQLLAFSKQNPPFSRVLGFRPFHLLRDNGEAWSGPSGDPVGVGLWVVILVALFLRVGFTVAVPVSLPLPVEILLNVLLALGQRELAKPEPSSPEEKKLLLRKVDLHHLNPKEFHLQGAARRGRSPTPQPKRVSPPRKASPLPESAVLHIDQLTRNVNEGHLKEIFGNFGEVIHVELAIDRAVNLPRGFGYVEFRKKVDAEKAILYMDGAQIDGNVVRVRFTLPPRQKPSSPPKVVAPKRDVPLKDKVAGDTEKDLQPKVRESSPRRKPLSPPPRRRSPPAHRRGESPRRRPESSPARRVDSPVHRRADSPYRHGEPLSRRRPASPPRRRSPSPAPRRHRSPIRVSPRRGRGSPVRKRSPIPPRLRSPPRRVRSPPRRSPGLRRRTRSPVRRPVRPRSRSASPRRGRVPLQRRGRSNSSYSGSPSPRKGGRRISKSRSPRRPARGRSSSNSPSSSSPPPKPN